MAFTTKRPDNLPQLRIKRGGAPQHENSSGLRKLSSRVVGAAIHGTQRKSPLGAGFPAKHPAVLGHDDGPITCEMDNQFMRSDAARPAAKLGIRRVKIEG